MNKKISWLNNIFITLITFLTLVGFISNLVQNIINSNGDDGSWLEYIFLSIYIFPALIIWGLIKGKRAAYLIAGIWCAISSVFILITILFTPIAGAIWIIGAQFIIVITLAIIAFYLWRKIFK